MKPAVTAGSTAHSGGPRPPSVAPCGVATTSLAGGGHRARTASMRADGRRGQRRPVQSPAHAPYSLPGPLARRAARPAELAADAAVAAAALVQRHGAHVAARP